jgi:pimeloyl-ACP methyl ester carboxylesterase
MLKEITFQNNKISYDITGDGIPLMLLHGYLLSSQIWMGLRELLNLKYKVIAIDLPGHGKSGEFPPVHSMDLMAEATQAVLQNENIGKCNFLCHSMGGYVGLAFLENYPDYVERMMLLNTHPFEDTNQKIAIRNRIIRLLKKEKKDFLLGQLLAELISPTDEERFSKIRESSLDIISCQSILSLIATTRGLKIRPDRSSLLRDPEVPIKWVLGQSDQQMDADNIIRKVRKFSIIEPELIEGEHMSFLEDPYNVFRIAHNFFYDKI